ncbi:LysE family translocator [Jannaschia sp. W003]|uniref:LysE family translocator n=1 Tax=Jannaschia sp. W003 TaxID=2867012 RepID=UPI0021A95920|nr:LysE family transporter [Jannaschia sp. W003]UWQ22893.1 LysE family transporter [Jannaschia sp. W003]
MGGADALLIGLATFAVVCASPGPAGLAVVSTAMARGFAASLPLTLGLALALGVWGVVAAAGLGAVLLAAPSALLAFKLFAGLFLLWLAWGAGRSALRPDTSPAPPLRAGFRAGLLLNLSNPKAVLAWSATIAVGTAPDAPWTGWLLVPLAMALTVAIYVAYALAFSRAPLRRAYGRARRGIDGVAAVLFGLAGLAMLRDAAVSLARRGAAA